ncbi:hypothetical protein Tco_0396058 [Tanacetum coccineum]
MVSKKNGGIICEPYKQKEKIEIGEGKALWRNYKLVLFSSIKSTAWQILVLRQAQHGGILGETRGQCRTTATSSTNVNREVELTASIDGQAKTITEASLRRHLKLEDNGGITSLPNTEIFDATLALPWDALLDTSPGASVQITSQPSYHLNITLNPVAPVNVTPPITETSPTEEPAPIPHESPLQSVHSLGCDEVVCSAESPKRVKKLEMQVKTSKASRRTKIVLSEDDDVEEDSSKQWRNEDESVQKKSKKQEPEEKLGHEEALRLQEQINEEERKRIVKDAEIAKQYHALQNRPRYVAEVRKNMMVYLKNKGGYKMKDFKGMNYDDIRPIFEKAWDQIHIQNIVAVEGF